MPTRISQAVVFTDSFELESHLRGALSACGLQAVVTHDVRECRSQIREAAPSVVFVDLENQGMDGVSVVEALHTWVDPLRVVVLVNEDSVKRAASAADGAVWHLKKPVSVDEVGLTVRQIRRVADARMEAPPIYGSSPELQAALETAGQVAPRACHLLIVGEPGTGKRLFSRFVHWRSPRRSAPFTPLSCTGLSRRALAAELFGDVEHDRVEPAGCLDRSIRGTLAIDDVEQMDPTIQEQLYERLRSRRGNHDGSVRIRLIGISSVDLEEEARQGRFHSGLLDLLGSATLRLASLRDRLSDIPLLSDQFCYAASERTGRSVKGATTEALGSLMAYDWPGNVRELRHVIDNAVAKCRGRMLALEDLPVFPKRSERPSASLSFTGTIQEIEKEAILRALNDVGGSTSQAAKRLNMSVRKIQYKVKEYREASSLPIVSEIVRAPGPFPSHTSTLAAASATWRIVHSRALRLLS